MPNVPGTLYVVATPIGNLADISQRACEVLGRVTLVAAEDTRRAGQMLTRLGIDARLVSLHEHNEARRVSQIIAALEAGDSVALISDAGTPLVSDPGYRLLAAARAAVLPVSPVPGPCAMIAALSVAGLPTDRFRFEGFLPPRGPARRKRLRELANCPDTLVIYEAVHRVRATLADMAEAFGSARPLAVCRELTKLHECIYRGTIDAVVTQMEADPGAGRGEFTIVVGGMPVPAEAAAPDLERVVALLLEELPPARAAALAARLTGAQRREAYRLASLLKPGR